MPDHLGGDMRKVKHEPEEEEKEFKSKLTVFDITLLSLLKIKVCHL